MEKSIVLRFVKENPLFDMANNDIKRALYLSFDDGIEAYFIVEYKEVRNERKTFVFTYECGMLYSVKTEINTMEKYLMSIPNSYHSEFINFE